MYVCLISSVQKYEVKVHVGDRWAADTDANMYITLHGSKGDSGRRCLYHSLDNDLKFQKNQVRCVLNIRLANMKPSHSTFGITMFSAVFDISVYCLPSLPHLKCKLTYRVMTPEQVDTFLVEAVSLQELKKLVISHDGEGHGAGVYIDRVVVRETEGEAQDQEVVFPCNQWLDDHEGDKRTERELRPAGRYSIIHYCKLQDSPSLTRSVE